MEDKVISDKTDNKKEESSDGFNIREYLMLVWRKKWWVMLSILVCCAVSVYLYKREALTYGSSADVMLLFDNSGASRSNAVTALQDLTGNSSSNVNFANELAILRSPALMETVIERLNLNTQYTADGFGHREDLYGHSPVVVNFMNLSPDSAAYFTIRKGKAGHVLASDFSLNGKSTGSKTLDIPLGAVVKTPVGDLAISPTSDISRFPEKIYVSHPDISNLANTMSSRVTTIRSDESNSIVTINYSDASQARATDVVRGIIEAYSDLWITEQNRSAVNTSNFIKDRLAIIEKELSGIDSDISHVKSAHQVADFSAAAESYYSQSMNYDTRAFETTTQLSIAQFLRDYLRGHNDDSSLIPANTGTSGAIETQIQEYNKMLLKRNALLENSTENNPVIAQMNSDLATNRNLIMTSLNNLISTYEIQANRATGRGADFSGKVSSVPEQEKQILSIERQQKVKENLYVYLLQKREENELARMITVNNTRVIRAAHPTGAITAGIRMALMAGAGIGLAIPLIICFLIIQFNTKVTRKSDLAAITVPFLGEMPLSPRGSRKNTWYSHMFKRASRTKDDKDLQLVVREHSRNYINEAFRMMRTTLDFMVDTNKGAKVIMLTSFNPGSGKTFISMNLAQSLALKEGKRVILVDVDLRRASLSKQSVATARGLSSYLIGKTDNIDDLIQHHSMGKGIDVLPVGAIPPNPSELLLGTEFDTLMEHLRSEYDYIILDCPPYDLVADTAILSRVADMTIFVMRAGLFDKSMLPDLEELYQEHKLPRMAIVLNGVDPRKSYYAKRYGYSGYDGYYISDKDD